MENKNFWLMLGLTVILAVVVSLSTISLTGNAIKWGFSSPKTTLTSVTTPSNIASAGTTPWRFSCLFVSNTDGTQLIGKKPSDVCHSLNNNMVPILMEKRFMYIYYPNKDCSGKILFEDRDTLSVNIAGNRSDNLMVKESSQGRCEQSLGGYYHAMAEPSGVLCCEVISNT